MQIFTVVNDALPEATKPKAKRPRLQVLSDLEDEFFLRYMDKLGVPDADATVRLAYPSNLRNRPMLMSHDNAHRYPKWYLDEARDNVRLEAPRDLSEFGLEGIHSRRRRCDVIPCDRERIIDECEKDASKIDALPISLDGVIDDKYSSKPEHE